MERLTHRISNVVSNRDWHPFKVGGIRFPMLHLMFVDDLPSFAEAILHQVKVIRSCLKDFCEAFGAKVNQSKTIIYFSRGVGNLTAERLSTTSDFVTTQMIGNYLGVPISSGHVTRQTFNKILDNAQRKLLGWKIRTLSLARRSTLLNSVLQNLP